jgi:hypothetical protein
MVEKKGNEKERGKIGYQDISGRPMLKHEFDEEDFLIQHK